jgi:hypothetical protein
MLENYELTQDGVVKQINYTPFKYSKEYSDIRYTNKHSDRGNILNLRFGYIVGSIGKIPESIMDVGYGNGDFLSSCKPFIKKLYGNDIEPAYPLEEDIKFVKDITQQYAEVITFFDCLEHFDDIDFMKNLQCDYVIIGVPWCYNSADDNWFSNWRHLNPDEHLHHFDEKSLKTFMNRQGYTLINYCNIEDKIRVDNKLEKNILTACFKKINHENTIRKTN